MIELRNVTKYFTVNGKKNYILKNVNLTIKEGVNVGILGRNGAGKSTLLRMLGGIEFPNSGVIYSPKTFSWPMGLAGGFQGSMTARQNIKFVCRVYGKSEEEAKDTIEYVKEFAEIGDYFDMPMKLYSSGMRSRVSFGLSLAFDFDYIISDESLSVGDESFKKKAKEALMKKIESSNILLVSHSMGDLRKICQAGIVLNEGEMKFFDDISDAIEFYHNINRERSIGNRSKKSASSSIYCSDGRVFDNMMQAAQFYKIRPYAIQQAIEKNSGSLVYLKRVFYRDGEKPKPYKRWENVEDNTLICSDGIIFESIDDAVSFYKERLPKAEVTYEDIAMALKSENKLAEKIFVKFYYLKEFQ